MLMAVTILCVALVALEADRLAGVVLAAFVTYKLLF